MKLKPQFRDFEFKSFDEEKRTVELSFSSEEPYERWWGMEILDHSTTSVNMERLNNSAPLLFNHDRDVVIGVIEYAKVENNRGIALVRFGNSAKAKEVFSDVVDGIMKNVSVGYQIDEMKLESESDGLDTYRVTRWQPFEISIVSIPADNTVGVGRGADNLKEFEVKILNQKNKEIGMTPEEKRALEEKQKNDLKQAQSEARADERTRVRELTTIGSRFNQNDLAAKAVEDGTDVDTFRTMVLEKLGTAKPVDTKANDVMDEKDLQGYSFARALAAAVSGNWENAQIEKRASDNVAKMIGAEPQGFYVPHQVLKKELTTTTGGAIIDTTTGGANFIDILRNKLVISKLGAVVLSGLKGNVAIPKQTGSTNAYWIDEGGETTVSDIGLDLLSLSPKTVTASTGYSRQMLLQGNPDVEGLVMADLASALALEIDKSAISGTGANGQPKGILNTTGIGAVDCTDGLSWAKAVEFETAIAAENADVDNMHYIAGAGVTGKLKTTEIASGTARHILENGEVNGYDYRRTNQVGANTMLFGDFSQVVTGLWGGLDIIIDPYTNSKKGGVVITAFQSVDVGLRYAQAFSASTNIPA